MRRLLRSKKRSPLKPRKLNVQSGEQLEARQMAAVDMMVLQADAESEQLLTVDDSGRTIRQASAPHNIESGDLAIPAMLEGRPVIAHVDRSDNKIRLLNSVTNKVVRTVALPVKVTSDTQVAVADLNRDDTSEVLFWKTKEPYAVWLAFPQKSGMARVVDELNHLAVYQSRWGHTESMVKNAMRWAEVGDGDTFASATSPDGYGTVTIHQKANGQTLMWHAESYSGISQYKVTIDSRRLFQRVSPGRAAVAVRWLGGDQRGAFEVVLVDGHASAAAAFKMNVYEWERVEISYDRPVIDPRYERLGQHVVILFNNGETQIGVARGHELTWYTRSGNGTGFSVAGRSRLVHDVGEQDQFVVGPLPSRLGDRDGSGYVDSKELKAATDLVFSQLGKTGSDWEADFDLDGKVTVADAMAIALDAVLGVMLDEMTGEYNPLRRAWRRMAR